MSHSHDTDDDWDGERASLPEPDALDALEDPEQLDMEDDDAGAPETQAHTHRRYKGIAEEYQKTWQSLGHRGTTKGKMQLFEAYLLGDTPMTPAQMEAGCHVGAALPDYRSKASRQLAKCLLDQLGVRYFESENPKEKEAIQWVVSTIFLTVYAKVYQAQLNKYTQGAAEASGLDVSSMGHGYIRSILAKYDPTREEARSFNSYCDKKFAFLIQDEARKLLGRRGSKHHLLRLGLANAESMDAIDPEQRGSKTNDTGDLSGGYRKSLPFTPDIAEEIEDHEQRTLRQSVIRMLIQAPPATLTPKEVEFLGHYWEVIQQDEGAHNDALMAIGAKEDIAEKMGISPSRVSQLERSVSSKIAAAIINDRRYFDKATLEAVLPQASNSPKQPTRATPPIASGQLSEDQNTPAETEGTDHFRWTTRVRRLSNPTHNTLDAFETLCRSPLDAPPKTKHSIPAKRMTIKNRRPILEALRATDDLLDEAIFHYNRNHEEIDRSGNQFTFEKACKDRMRSIHGLDELVTNTIWVTIQQLNISDKQPPSAAETINAPVYPDHVALAAPSHRKTRDWQIRAKRCPKPVVYPEESFETLCYSPLSSYPQKAHGIQTEELTARRSAAVLKILRNTDPLLNSALYYFAQNYSAIMQSDKQWDFEDGCKKRMLYAHGLSEFMTETIMDLIFRSSARAHIRTQQNDEAASR